MPTQDDASGRTGFRPETRVLELHVGKIEQLFHSIDPAPFRERDLDPEAEDYVVGWARELRGDGPLALHIRIDQKGGETDPQPIVKDAIRSFFEQRAIVTRQRLRQLMRVGRTSLSIGLLFLATSILLGDVLEAALRTTRFGGVVRESLLIGGWVAMWRPLEIFLYDWWPIRAEARLFDRLSVMTVEVTGG